MTAGQDVDLNFLSNLGVGGLLCWLVLKEVFSFLKTKNKGDDANKDMQSWLLNREMEKAISALVEVSRQQTIISQQILDEQRSMRLYLGKIVLTHHDSDHPSI